MPNISFSNSCYQNTTKFLNLFKCLHKIFGNASCLIYCGKRLALMVMHVEIFDLVNKELTFGLDTHELNWWIENSENFYFTSIERNKWDFPIETSQFLELNFLFMHFVNWSLWCGWVWISFRIDGLKKISDRTWHEN